MTDQSGQVVWQADYRPFGEIELESGAASQKMRLPGQYADGASGLYYNYYRDYDPMIGRYVQSDPIGLDGGLNSFAYVGGNPLRFVDPLGLATAVIVNGPTSGNPFGPTAVATTGSGVYSFGNGTGLGSSLTKYVQREAPRRDTNMVIINTTPEQEAAIIQCLANYADDVNAYPDNCANRTSESLICGGMLNPNGFFPNVPSSWPTDVLYQAAIWQQILGGETVSVPRNSTQVPPSLNQFDPRTSK